MSPIRSGATETETRQLFAAQMEIRGLTSGKVLFARKGRNENSRAFARALKAGGGLVRYFLVWWERERKRERWNNCGCIWRENFWNLKFVLNLNAAKIERNLSCLFYFIHWKWKRSSRMLFVIMQNLFANKNILDPLNTSTSPWTFHVSPCS